MASINALHQALEQAVEYITGVIPEAECSPEEKRMVARFASLLAHPKHEGPGQCPYCGHFGDDCTGSKPTAVDLFREAVELKLKWWDKLGDIERAMGGELTDLDATVGEFAITVDDPATIDEDEIVSALAQLELHPYAKTE